MNNPTPAASRAATPDQVRAQFEHWYSDEGRSPTAIKRNNAGFYVLMGAHSAWRAWEACAAALEAAQPASPAPLTDEREQLRAEQAANVMPQIGPLLDAWDGLNNDTACLIRDEAPDLKRALEAVSRAMDGAALASPQVAPAPKPVLWVNPEQAAAHTDPANLIDPDWNAKAGRYLPCRRTSAGKFTMPLYAAPVQVDPPGFKLVPIEPTRAMLLAACAVEIEDFHGEPTVPDKPEAAELWGVMLAAAPAPVAPQDDARDAAEPAREREAVRNRYCGARMCLEEDEEHNVSCRRHTPAAKPTEPTLPTQGEQSHD